VKKMILIILVLCFFSLNLIAGVTVLNCGVPRKLSGAPGDTLYSILVVTEPAHSEISPQFFLVSQNSFRLSPTLTEPLKITEHEATGCWILTGRDTRYNIHGNFSQCGVKFISGQIPDLWCR